MVVYSIVANNDNLTYSWSLSVPPGSSVSLNSTTAVAPSFTSDKDGDYVATLIVNDGLVSSQSDSVLITSMTSNSAPNADAGPDQNVSTGNQVTLNGSNSSDANNDNLTYSWSLSRPVNSSATLSSTTAVAPTFTADVDGDYVATLVVNDG